MKFKFLLFTIFIILFSSCNSKNGKMEIITNGKSSSISFKKEIHDFGEIPEKQNAIAIFNFSNKGGSPLVITNVKTSCGCTVPEYPKGVIKSGEDGKIKIIYDAKYPGRFNKTITVFYNGKDSPKTLTVKGEIPYPKDLDST